MNWFWASILALLFLQSASWAAAEKGNSPGARRVEKYRYAAMPVGGEASHREWVEVELIDEDRGFEYISKTTSPEEIEEITIHTDRKGRFISGLRTTSSRHNGSLQQEKVWMADRKAYVEKGTGDEKKRKEHELPQDAPLAVDGSLLILLRSFPFNQGKGWKVFMIDFSGYAVTVTIRQEGIERIVVPAGEFECYRIEIVVDLPIYHPKVTNWISTRKPNFLVKYQGKKGPFTPSYITTLVTLE
jgi:hypothetical protein